MLGVHAVDGGGALLSLQLACQNFDECGLACTGGAQQTEDLSLADFQADIVQDFLFSKGFGDAVNDDGFAHYASSLSLFSASASF